MDSPAPPLLPEPEPAQFGLSRRAKWLITIVAGIGLIAMALLLRVAVRFWLRPAPLAVTEAPSGWVQLGNEVELHGLVPGNQHHDGVTEPDVAGGLPCHVLRRYPGRPELYAYFRVDPTLKQPGTNRVTIEVEYFDGEPGGHFRLDYDSFDDASRAVGAYTQSKEQVNFKGTQTWRKARFQLDDARFEGRENDQTDFRLAVIGHRFCLRSVKLARE